MTEITLSQITEFEAYSHFCYQSSSSSFFFGDDSFLQPLIDIHSSLIKIHSFSRQRISRRACENVF